MEAVNCRTLGRMCECLLDGEPVFVIRAQDRLAVEAVKEYLDMAERAGALNTFRSRAQVERIQAWQKENPNRVKTPD